MAYYDINDNDDGGDPIIPSLNSPRSDNDSKRDNSNNNNNNNSSRKKPKSKSKSKSRSKPKSKSKRPEVSIRVDNSTSPEDDGMLMSASEGGSRNSNNGQSATTTATAAASLTGSRKRSADHDIDNFEEPEFERVELKDFDRELMDSMENEPIPDGYDDHCPLCLIPYQDVDAHPALRAIEDSWIGGIKRGVKLEILSFGVKAIYDAKVRPHLCASDKRGIEMKDIPWKASTVADHFIEHVQEVNTLAALASGKFTTFYKVCFNELLQRNKNTKEIRLAFGATSTFRMLKDSVETAFKLKNIIASDNGIKRNKISNSSGLEVPT